MAKKSLSASMAAELNTKTEQARIPKAKKSTPPSRQGTRAIGGHFPPEVGKQLKILSAETDRTNQSLLAEALNLLFEKHGKAPIAQ